MRWCVRGLVLVGLLGCGRVGFEPTDGSSMDAATRSDAGPRADGGRGDAGPLEAICGDGERGGAEACDDGNAVAGDGCENDCTFSCEVAEACDDGELCSGSERCDADRHVCVAGEALADGEPCGEGRSCRGGRCAAPGCGDGMLGEGEDCDDGNDVAEDGCESDCTFSCVADDECEDGDPCNGVGSCGPTNACSTSLAPAEGSLCDRDADPATRDICLHGGCARSRCGDGFVDDMEGCDDGNLIDADGCDADCTFTCEDDTTCDDELPCNGRERCDLSTHRCASGTDAPDRTPCPGGFCASGSCVVTDAGRADAGGIMPADAGPSDAGPPRFGPCRLDVDCLSGERCCPGCPGMSGTCWPTFDACPLIMCPFDGGSGS